MRKHKKQATSTSLFIFGSVWDGMQGLRFVCQILYIIPEQESEYSLPLSPPHQKKAKWPHTNPSNHDEHNRKL